MASPIEDYALIGDRRTAALVARDGSIDWLCLPRFDSGACFAALIGEPGHGRWQIAPAAGASRVRRAYREGTMALETTFEDADGAVALIDFMPLATRRPTVVRIVRGVRGRVKMRTELVVRFDYGSIVPWVRKARSGLVAVAGPDSLHVASDVPLRGEGLTTVGEFEVAEGQSLAMSLAWSPSHTAGPEAVDELAALAEDERRWRSWSRQCAHAGPHREAVVRSLLTLSALTHAETGAILAAPTTSLPESLRGVRNWDYRYCWLRDATFTLLALVHNGFLDEARIWREWLLRAVAGDASKLQILYRLDGARRVDEAEIPWLPGYEGARPVRVGNAAWKQEQLDVYGEILDSMYHSQRVGLEPDPNSWELMKNLLEFLEGRWQDPDDGIWEIRGEARRFTHSRVMAWVAFDRAVRIIEEMHQDGPVERWRALREEIHRDICQHGYDPDVGSFVQSYGSRCIDAALLTIPLVGFLPPTDPRVLSTARAIERSLMHEGLVRRYDERPSVDGLPVGDGVFLPCTFWLADNWILSGRIDDARRLLDRLVGLSNDVGLLSEDYDVAAHRLVGNFPQTITHVSLVNTALNLSRAGGPAHTRAGA